MDRFPNWAWWTVAGGILLSPVFAFLLAVLVEILIGVLTQGGVRALLIVATAVSGWLMLRKHRTRLRAGDQLSDQAYSSGGRRGAMRTRAGSEDCLQRQAG